MCGFVFVDQDNRGLISGPRFEQALRRQQWRGPDSLNITAIDDGRFLVGHTRLSIIDPGTQSDQPMLSRSGRYLIVYNGEIYNHRELRKQLNVDFRTDSDTETILEGYALVGERIFELIDGMFAILILDSVTKEWIAARDPFGIKPLFMSARDGMTIVASEAATVACLSGATLCSDAIAEWKIIRRPLPGKSFFSNVVEVLPGTIVRSSGANRCYWKLMPSNEAFSQEEFESRLVKSITRHQISDVENVSLLSGGLDSAVITAVSTVQKAYCVGLKQNNEFDEARDTAHLLHRRLVTVDVSTEELRGAWRYLTKLRGEPLCVPNEGLIYLVCKAMEPTERVFLTGEGADELLFGYNVIVEWAADNKWAGVKDFLLRYGYSQVPEPTDRLCEHIEMLRSGKTGIEFIEDLFYELHLPGLLRRMDFAAMAASKEARVPFVCKDLVSYMYRRPAKIRLTSGETKIPLRRFAERLGLHRVLTRKKIGFSAQIEPEVSRYDAYMDFQQATLGALSW